MKETMPVSEGVLTSEWQGNLGSIVFDNMCAS